MDVSYSSPTQKNSPTPAPASSPKSTIWLNSTAASPFSDLGCFLRSPPTPERPKQASQSPLSPSRQACSPMSFSPCTPVSLNLSAFSPSPFMLRRKKVAFGANSPAQEAPSPVQESSLDSTNTLVDSLREYHEVGSEVLTEATDLVSLINDLVSLIEDNHLLSVALKSKITSNLSNIQNPIRAFQGHLKIIQSKSETITNSEYDHLIKTLINHIKKIESPLNELKLDEQILNQLKESIPNSLKAPRELVSCLSQPTGKPPLAPRTYNPILERKFENVRMEMNASIFELQFYLNAINDTLGGGLHHFSTETLALQENCTRLFCTHTERNLDQLMLNEERYRTILTYAIQLYNEHCPEGVFSEEAFHSVNRNIEILLNNLTANLRTLSEEGCDTYESIKDARTFEINRDRYNLNPSPRTLSHLETTLKELQGFDQQIQDFCREQDIEPSTIAEAPPAPAQQPLRRKFSFTSEPELESPSRAPSPNAAPTTPFPATRSPSTPPPQPTPFPPLSADSRSPSVTPMPAESANLINLNEIPSVTPEATRAITPQLLESLPPATPQPQAPESVVTSDKTPISLVVTLASCYGLFARMFSPASPIISNPIIQLGAVPSLPTKLLALPTTIEVSTPPQIIEEVLAPVNEGYSWTTIGMTAAVGVGAMLVGKRLWDRYHAAPQLSTWQQLEKMTYRSASLSVRIFTIIASILSIGLLPAGMALYSVAKDRYRK